MRVQFKQTKLHFFFLLGFALVLAACQAENRMHATPKSQNPAPAIEDKLVPTVSHETKTKSGAAYEAPPSKIKNKKTEILLDRVLMTETLITYDPTTRHMHVSGTATVLDDDKTEIASAPFSLSGTHEADDGTFNLSPDKGSKANSLESPVVRAEITCLMQNAKEEFDCSQAIVDFFVAYRKKIYTEQMQLAKSAEAQTLPPVTADPAPKAETQPKVPDTVVDTPTTSPDLDPDNLQKEGEEESKAGRFEGQAGVVNLKKVFAGDEAAPVADDDDDDEVSAIPPTTSAAPTDVKPEGKPSATTPTPKPDTSAKAPTTPKPSTPKPLPAKEIPISKDLRQTKEGDIRQINQSLGFPDQGLLRNATSVLAKQQALKDDAAFEVVKPDSNRFFSTYEMADMISRLGKNLVKTFKHKVYVGNISQKSGGKISPHLSHQIGLDADLAYPANSTDVKFPLVVQMSTRHFFPSNFSVAKTFETMKYAFTQSDIKVDRIFADRTIKKALCDYARAQGEFNGKDKDLVQTLFQSIDHVDGHGDHFHLRLKCSIYDPGCRQKIYTVNNGCG